MTGPGENSPPAPAAYNHSVPIAEPPKISKQTTSPKPGNEKPEVNESGSKTSTLCVDAATANEAQHVAKTSTDDLGRLPNNG